MNNEITVKIKNKKNGMIDVKCEADSPIFDNSKSKKFDFSLEPENLINNTIEKIIAGMLQYEIIFMETETEKIFEFDPDKNTVKLKESKPLSLSLNLKTNKKRGKKS